MFLHYRTSKYSELKHELIDDILDDFDTEIKVNTKKTIQNIIKIDANKRDD